MDFLTLKGYQPTPVPIFEDLVGETLETVQGKDSFYHSLLACTNAGGYSVLSLRDRIAAVRKLRKVISNEITARNPLFSTPELAFEYIKAYNGHPDYIHKLKITQKEAIARFMLMCNKIGKFGLHDKSFIYHDPSEEMVRLYENWVLKKDEVSKSRLIDIKDSGKVTNEIHNFNPLIHFSEEFQEKYYELKSRDDSVYDVTLYENSTVYQNHYEINYYSYAGGMASFYSSRNYVPINNFIGMISNMGKDVNIIIIGLIACLLNLNIFLISPKGNLNSILPFLCHNKTSDYILIKKEDTTGEYTGISVGGNGIFHNDSILIKKIYEKIYISQDKDIIDDIQVVDNLGIPIENREDVTSPQIHLLPSSVSLPQKSLSMSRGSSSYSVKRSVSKSTTFQKSKTYEFEFSNKIRELLLEFTGKTLEELEAE